MNRPESLWLDSLPPIRGEPALVGAATADIAVVGGGLLGLWTALWAKRSSPSASVALLERELCGSGASGRNGGFVMSWWSKFPTLQKLVGTEEALRLARASEEALDQVEAIAGPDAGFQRRGWAWVASSRAQIGSWRAVEAGLRELGEERFRELVPSETLELTGAEGLHGGVFEASCATVQPAALVRALRSAVLEAGVLVFEGSPVRKLRRASRGISLITADGDLSCDRAVLALGPWAGSLLPPLRGRLIVVSGDIVATVPATEALDGIGMRRGLAISDSRLLVNYFHRTAEDRIVFGTAGGALGFGRRVSDRFRGPSPIRDTIDANLRRFYPSLQARVSHDWAGPVDRSVSGIPILLDDGAGMLAAAGFSGNGLGPTVVVGRLLASRALGLDDEWATSPLIGAVAGRFPPEPARYVGGRIVRHAVAAAERAGDQGRSAGRVVRFLASQAPAGLVPTAATGGSAQAAGERTQSTSAPG